MHTFRISHCVVSSAGPRLLFKWKTQSLFAIQTNYKIYFLTFQVQDLDMWFTLVFPFANFIFQYFPSVNYYEAYENCNYEHDASISSITYSKIFGDWYSERFVDRFKSFGIWRRVIGMRPITSRSNWMCPYSKSPTVLSLVRT